MASRVWRVRALMPLALVVGFSTFEVTAQTPASVGIPGSYQSESGCAGDWGARRKISSRP